MPKKNQPDKGSILLPKLRFEDATAKQDVRFYLNSPYLDLSGDRPVLVATNGHVLISVECEIDGKVSEGSIGLEAVQRCRKDAKHDAAILRFNDKMHGTGKVMFERPNWDQKITYPKWRNVIPDVSTDGDPDCAFNDQYFSLMSKAFGKRTNAVGLKFGRKKPKGRQKVTEIDPRQAIQVRSADPEIADLKYNAVIMPMRF